MPAVNALAVQVWKATGLNLHQCEVMLMYCAALLGTSALEELVMGPAQADSCLRAVSAWLSVLVLGVCKLLR